MPRVPALIEAERKLAILEDTTLEPLRVERAILLDQLAHLDREIAHVLTPVQAAINEAYEQQKWTLTKWVPSESGHSYNRYALRIDGAPDKCWDNRAWLRIMKHGGDDPAKERWWWTLTIHHPKHAQITLDPRAKNPSAPRPTPEEMFRAADEALIAAGYSLTDIAPESFKT